MNTSGPMERQRESTLVHWLTTCVAAFGILLSTVLAGEAGTAWADENQSQIWPVKRKLVSKDGDRSEDVSGIACIGEGFPRSCLVIDDKMQAAQFVTLENGELTAGEAIRLIHNQFADKALELDGEGVAYADHSFYVMGSHGHPRDKEKKLDPVANAAEIGAKIQASSQVVRIRVNSTSAVPMTGRDVKEIKSSSKLREIIAAEPTLARFLDRRLENNGVTIEGIAVVGRRLIAGFREPSLENGRSPVLSVLVDALYGSEAAEPKLFLLRLGEGRGVRDLAPFENGLLVLAGPAGDEAGPYSVYWWAMENEEIRFLADITKATDASKQRKPEAILPLDKGPSGLRVLILSDGAKEGEPRAIVVPAP